jgi:hypothetical protein
VFVVLMSHTAATAGFLLGLQRRTQAGPAQGSDSSRDNFRIDPRLRDAVVLATLVNRSAVSMLLTSVWKITPATDPSRTPTAV